MTEEAKKTEITYPADLSPDVLTKYKTSAEIVAKVLKSVIQSSVIGASILEICQTGDKAIEEAVSGVYNKDKSMLKGIAFPTCISVNNVINNFSPLPSDYPSTSATPDPSAHPTLYLQPSDVVKILLGVHIDGFASIAAETIVLPASADAPTFSNSSPLEGIKANLLAAAYYSAEAALRVVKAGIKNWEVSDIVEKVVREYSGDVAKDEAARIMEGGVSYQHTKNVIDGKKKILLGVTSHQEKVDKDNQFTLEEGEVYGLDIVVTNSPEGKTKTDLSRTTIYSKVAESNYSLKMKTSRAIFSEISKKAGSFPFSLRSLDDEKRARMGVQECVQHNLVRPFEISTTPRSTDLSVQIFLTFAVSKNSATRITHFPPVSQFLDFSSSNAESNRIVKPNKEVKDEELKALITRSLKPTNKKKKNDAAKEGEGESKS